MKSGEGPSCPAMRLRRSGSSRQRLQVCQRGSNNARRISLDVEPGPSEHVTSSAGVIPRVNSPCFQPITASDGSMVPTPPDASPRRRRPDGYRSTVLIGAPA